MGQRFPAVTFARTLAGLVILALGLAGTLAGAQHAASSAGHAAGAGIHLGAPPSSGGVSRSPSVARPPSSPTPGVRVPSQPQPGRILVVHSPLGFQNASASVRARAFLPPGSGSQFHRFLGRGLGFRGEPARPFLQYPYFFFGGGQPACSPFLPGYLGDPWFDRQFTCFGIPFYGVQFYPPGFLAPELAYEPWLEGLATGGEQQMYDDTLAVEDLDITAAIAATESYQSNPDEQITMLVLKDGIAFSVTDYWVEDGKLGYVTTYQRENTIDLDRLDLDQTVKLNSMRGIPFVLRERPAPSTPPQ
jgi:hypothetical protein